MKNIIKLALLGFLSVTLIGCESNNGGSLDKNIDTSSYDTYDQSVDDYYCGSNSYNCDDFSSHGEAQDTYEYCYAVKGWDVHKLDRDNDGLACETL